MHMPARPATAKLLLVDDDSAILEALTWATQDAGYTVAAAGSLQQAHDLLRDDVFQLVVTDLLDHSPDGGIPNTRSLVLAAQPTPVALATAWKLPAAWPERADFAFILGKPFDLDDLLTRIAETLGHSPTEHDQWQHDLVHRFFSALENADWEALRAVCVSDLRYTLDGASKAIESLDAYIARVRERETLYPDFRFPQIATYPLPLGLAVRFATEWTRPDGTLQRGSGGVVFRFRDNRIAQIGVSSPSTLPLVTRDPAN